MKITDLEIRNIAKLARLELAVEEVSPLTKQLDDILNYIEKLNTVNTEGVEPTTHAIFISNAFPNSFLLYPFMVTGIWYMYFMGVHT